MYFISK